MDALCAESERERARLQQPPNSHHEARVPRKACASAEEGEDEWVSLDLRCALTFELITDPAKGSSCTHDACCNFGACATMRWLPGDVRWRTAGWPSRAHAT